MGWEDNGVRTMINGRMGPNSKNRNIPMSLHGQDIVLCAQRQADQKRLEETEPR